MFPARSQAAIARPRAVFSTFWACRTARGWAYDRPDAPGGRERDQVARHSVRQLGCRPDYPISIRGLTVISLALFPALREKTGSESQLADSYPRFMRPLSTVWGIRAITGPTPRTRAHSKREELHPLPSKRPLSSSWETIGDSPAQSITATSSRPCLFE